eukprot:scaffold1379_cov209-Alexandrium_tamarense.AAC.22
MLPQRNTPNSPSSIRIISSSNRILTSPDMEIVAKVDVFVLLNENSSMDDGDTQCTTLETTYLDADGSHQTRRWRNDSANCK